MNILTKNNFVPLSAVHHDDRVGEKFYSEERQAHMILPKNRKIKLIGNVAFPCNKPEGMTNIPNGYTLELVDEHDGVFNIAVSK